VEPQDGERDLVRRMPPVGPTARITDVDSGWTSRVYVVDDGRFVVKFPRSEAIKAEYAREIAVLQGLAAHRDDLPADVVLPRVTDVGKDHAYLAYEGVVGLPLDDARARLDPPAQARVGTALGRFLRVLHALDLPAMPVMTVEDEIAQFQGKHAEARDVLAAALTATEFDAVDVLVHETLPRALRDLGDDPALCHGDLGPWNLVLTPEGRVGVIDFGDVGRWDRSKDLMGLPDGVLEAALAAYGERGEAFRAKVEHRRTVLALLDLPYFAGTGNAAGVARTIARIRAAVAG
jgi:aminoglycoside phosphotransferase (APT) family kinase protein